jgi:hypothetical protein
MTDGVTDGMTRNGGCSRGGGGGYHVGLAVVDGQQSLGWLEGEHQDVRWLMCESRIQAPVWLG